LAASIVGNGHVKSWQELLGYLHTFHTPGLLGPDGQPLSKNTSQYDQVIIDVSRTNGEIIEFIKKSPEVIWSLPPRKYEEIVVVYLANKDMRLN
jgi:restriction system protein